MKTLDPDLIRIRTGIQPEMLDLDPVQMNTDPQPCLKKEITFKKRYYERSIKTKRFS
jgi:hypothetical protein